jgi:hypothetical protein
MRLLAPLADTFSHFSWAACGGDSSVQVRRYPGRIYALPNLSEETVDAAASLAGI